MKTSDCKITASRAAFISGINYPVLLRRIENGQLRADRNGTRWQISLDNFQSFCKEEWDAGRVYMYDPETLQKRVDFFVFGIDHE